MAAPATGRILKGGAGRILSRTADGVTTSYTYDLDGDTLTASAGGLTITSAYDRRSRVVSTDDEDSGTAPDTTYQYGLSSVAWADPTGSYQSTLDRFDRVTSLSDPVNPLSFTWQYHADGQPSGATQPNSNFTAITYDALGRPSTRVTKAGGTTSQASYSWTRNQAGQVLSETTAIATDPTNDTRTLAYDPLGRLVSYSDGTTTTYAWDAVPNRTAVTIDTGSARPTSYDTANRPTTQNGVVGSFTTDADGRLTARPNPDGTGYQRLTWDHLGRLTSVLPTTGSTPIVTNTYDALDRLRTADYGSSRVRFRYRGVTTTAVQLIDDLTGSVLLNVGASLNGVPLEDWIGAGGSLRLYGTNGHGDVTWTASPAGSVGGTRRYDPFGASTSTTGSMPDFRFQGSWADPATTLSWVVSRWYAPA
jgi:YD repeat-containing protein